MRSILSLFFALLLLGLASCSGDREKLNTDGNGKFTLSDAEIEAFEASPEPHSIGEGGGGRFSAVPPLFAGDFHANGVSRGTSVVVPGVVVPGPGDGGGGNGDSCKPKQNKCKQCKSKCGKCTKSVKSCKCKGGCKVKKDKCGKCKDKCGKCNDKKSCRCQGQCTHKCSKCKSKCGKCSRDRNCCCRKCPPPPCECEVKCTGITSSTEAQFEADCATHCAEVSYRVKLAFTDCPDRTDEALGHEVVFFRDGAEVGRATTDISGSAEFSEDCLALGEFAVEAKFEDCQTGFSVSVWEDCCEVVCEGMESQTERFILADCWETSASVPLQVKLNFSECPGQDFDMSGHGVTFETRDGAPIGVAVTDADGVASFTWANRGIGNHHIVVTSDQTCATEFIVTVHEECRYHACIKGKGRLPSKNGDRYMIFSYEGHVQDGHLEQANWMSFSDGDISFTNMPIDWIIVLGAEMYFGSADGNIMFHTIDLGPAPGADYIEVWILSENYYNSGNLLNGQIRSSWGLKKPPVAIP